MSKDQFDLFEQPPVELARGFSAEQVTDLGPPPVQGSKFYQAAYELVHFTAYLKLNDWQRKILWPHLHILLDRVKNEPDENMLYFELGYIISAQEIEQIRSRSAAAEICRKYGIEI